MRNASNPKKRKPRPELTRVSVDLPNELHKAFFRRCRPEVSMNQRIIELVRADVKAKG